MDQVSAILEGWTGLNTWVTEGGYVDRLYVERLEQPFGLRGLNDMINELEPLGWMIESVRWKLDSGHLSTGLFVFVRSRAPLR